MKSRILLKQHVGAPCRPIVQVGASVQRGQLIAEPQGLGANIHASVSGQVTEITDTSVVITYEADQSTAYLPIPETTNNLAAIEAAGIVGAGGAGFPMHVKFAKPIPGGTLIANAAECEPLLGHNIRFIEEHPEVIVRGMNYLMTIAQAEKGIIAIKTKYRKAMLALGKACQHEANISLKYLPDMYPAGDERVIIREILGVILEPGQLPIEANAIVTNVETIKRGVEAIEDRKPFIDKDVTVAGRVKNQEEIFFDQPIGTPVGRLIEASGGYIDPHGEIVIGGPFTGQHGEEDTPISKTTGGVLVAMPFPNENRKVGILICECGGGEQRLTEIAQGMGAEVVVAERCKRMVEVDGRYRCSLPGVCPGQAEKVLKMKKAGAEVVLTGTCQD